MAWVKNSLIKLLSILRKSRIRKAVYGYVENKLRLAMLRNNPHNYPEFVQRMKFHMLKSMFRSLMRNYEKGYISPRYLRLILKNLLFFAAFDFKKVRNARLKFEKEHGVFPPTFIVLSPTMFCNLRCKGCYANSHSATKNRLPYHLAEWVLKEAHDKFGSRFFVFSGGEPFLYRDGDKTIFDLWATVRDSVVMTYTNGTLINEEVAERLAELGNVTPAISVEGYEEETDARRGKGVYKKILRAFECLKKAGVPFGVSVTATASNCHLLLTDEFYDHYFRDLGASYMWIFQLMPIGRGTEVFQEMVPPDKRLEMFKVWKRMVEEKGYFVADFWNSGLVSDGCIAFGREGGYFYVDWDGKITPCVFVPYYETTVQELYESGKGLEEALKTPLFKRGREWQKSYGFHNGSNIGNWLMPCAIRDHFLNFKTNIVTSNTKPENPEAEFLLSSSEAEKLMKNYDEELARLSEPVWRAETQKKFD